MRRVQICLVIYLDNGEDNDRSASQEGHSSLQTLEPGVCNKPGKMLHGTKQSNGILEIHHKFGVHDNLSPRREKRKDNVLLQNAFECISHESKGNTQCIGNVDLKISSSITRSTPLLVIQDINFSVFKEGIGNICYRNFVFN